MATSDWLSPAEAGAIMGVGPDRVSQLAREGALTSMRTPGGHLRVRRDEVEQLVSDPENVPHRPGKQPPASAEPLDDTPEASPAPPSPPKPHWEDVPPWKRRVREAEADVHVLQLDDERERVLEERARRQAERQKANREEVTKAAEAERLRGLKTLALSTLPTGVPNDIQAAVAREMEKLATSERYPASLARGHAEALLRTDVERLLRPWRARVARRQRVQQEAAERDRILSSAALSATLRMPRNWNYDTRKAFEREVREVLEDEYEPGMTQGQLEEISLDLLDDWMDEESEDDE